MSAKLNQKIRIAKYTGKKNIKRLCLQFQYQLCVHFFVEVCGGILIFDLVSRVKVIVIVFGPLLG